MLLHYAKNYEIVPRAPKRNTDITGRTTFNS